MPFKLINHWSLFSRRSAIDLDSNHLIIGEVIEELTIQVPEPAYQKISDEITSNGSIAFPLEIELVSLYEGEPNTKYSVGFSMVTPVGKIIPLTEAEFKTGPNGRIRHRVRFNGLPLGGSGRHIVRVEVSDGSKKYQVAEPPLFVIIKPQ